MARIIRCDQVRTTFSVAARFEREALVPAYEVDASASDAVQQQQAAQAVSELVQKLRRLREAHGAWPSFEPGPYFDLYPGHVGGFCRVEETSRVLRVRIYADLLLPAFRAAERFWAETFVQAYRTGAGRNAPPEQKAQWRHRVSPTMAALLQDAETSVQGTLDLLSDDLEVLGSLGGLEERIQHRPPPDTRLAPGLPPSLQRLPREMPTLTLDVIYNQPHGSTPGQDNERLRLEQS